MNYLPEQSRSKAILFYSVFDKAQTDIMCYLLIDSIKINNYSFLNIISK